MGFRKITTHYARKETLPEILAEIEEFLEDTDPKQKIILTQVFNSMEGYFFEMIVVVEA